jgi:hypothetical protein
MTILAHNICSGFKGLSPKKMAPSNAIIEATTFIVSWRTKNFLIELKVCLPHWIVYRIDENLSFKNTISDAYFAD